MIILHDIAKMFTCRKILIAALFSIAVLLANYLVCNTSIPLPDEMVVLQKWDNFKAFNGWKKDSVPDEVMLINVAFDKELIDYSENGIPLGKTVITDRKKLLDFLNIAKKADNYRYIFMDVFFEEGYISETDSALFHTIAEMNRIVIPTHEDKKLQDSILYCKAANSDYAITQDENNFARFQYVHQGIKSVPLRMFEDINHSTISKAGPFYFSGGWLCRNGITLQMPISISEDNSIDEAKSDYNVYQLGVDILDMDTISSIAEELKDKIIVVGDFKEDCHDTYIGRQPGTIICLNAYYSLVRGDHSLLGKYGFALFFFLFVAALYFILVIFYLNGKSLASFINNAWLKVVVSFFSVNILFWIVASVAYISPLSIVYNVWIPTGAFSLLDFIINTYSKSSV